MHTNPPLAPGPLAATVGYALFDVPVGRCGIAWRGGTLIACKLPEPDDAGTVRFLLSRLEPECRAQAQRFDQDDPDLATVARTAIDQLRALMTGQPSDLASLPLDMSGVPEFNRRVYQLSMRIPPGRTLTYGEVARRLDEPGAARAVGQALGSNPFAPIVPCHRILAANGRSGGFSATGGVRTKLRLLAMESPPCDGTVQSTRGSEDQDQPADDLFGWRV